MVQDSAGKTVLSYFRYLGYKQINIVCQVNKVDNATRAVRYT